MDITILHENLHTAITDALRFIAIKAPMPVLTGIALSAHDGAVTLKATDLKMGYETTIGAKVEKDGDCVIPGKILGDLLSTLSAGPVHLKLEKDSLYLSQGKLKTKLPVFTTQDFPPFPQASIEPLTLDAGEFSRLLETVLYAASLDETRPVLSSLYLELNDKGITAVCTDGYRLAVNRSTKKHDGDPITVLLPAKAIGEVGHILSRSGSNEIRFGVSRELSQAFFYVGETTILVRTIEGQFPPFEQAIPQSFAFETTLDVASLQKMLKTALVFARESSSVVSFEFESNNCHIKASGVSVGEHDNVMEGSATTDEPRRISFNGKFVQDVLARVESERVILKMNDELKPGVFVPEASEYPIAVVMPFKR